MMARYYLIALIVSAGGFMIGSIILPRGGELALVYYKSGRYDTARKVLERELRQGILTPSNVHFGVNTYRSLGELSKAADLVRRYLEKVPTDLKARTALSRLYEEAGKPALMLQTLEDAEKYQPSAQRRVVLMHLYRENGRYKKWAAMLRRVVHDGDGGPKDYLDLARLEARGGAKKLAVRLMQALKTRAPKAYRIEALQFHVALLLDTDKIERARSTVTGWISRQKLDGLPKGQEMRAEWLLFFADLFEERGHEAQALKMLEPEGPTAWQHPKLLRVLTQLEIDQGLAVRALARLDGFRKDGRLKPAQNDLLVRTALATRRWETARKYALVVSADSLSGSLLLSLAVETLARRDKPFAEQLIKKVSPDLLTANPVAAAALTLAAGNSSEARRWSVSADQIPGLSLDQQIALVNVHVGLNQNDRAKAVLRRVATARSVAPEALIHLAALFAKYEMDEEGRLLVKRLSVRRPSRWATAAARVLSPIPKDAGARKKYLDLGWATFAGNKVATARLLSQLAASGITARRFALAAVAARKAHALAPTRATTLRLARALAYAGKPDEAVALVKPLAQKDPAAKIIYAEAIVAAVKTGTMPPASARGFITQFLTDKDVPFGQRQQAVYNLVAVKSADIVLPVLETLSRKGDNRFIDLHLEALLQAKRKKPFAVALRSAIRRTRDLERLRKYGKWAFQESLQTLAAQAYGRVLKARPNDPEALRHVGLVSYYSNNKVAARRYLTRYLATGAKDYEVEYTLGEVITAFPDWRKATPYFRRALARINRLRSPTYKDRKIRAHLLYRNGRFNDAINAYETLLKQNPRDRKLRERYVDFLTNIGRYERARRWQRGS